MNDSESIDLPAGLQDGLAALALAISQEHSKRSGHRDVMRIANLGASSVSVVVLGIMLTQQFDMRTAINTQGMSIASMQQAVERVQGQQTEIRQLLDTYRQTNDSRLTAQQAATDRVSVEVDELKRALRELEQRVSGCERSRAK